MFWQAGEFKQAPITPFPSTHWGLQHQPCRCDTHAHAHTNSSLFFRLFAWN